MRVLKNVLLKYEKHVLCVFFICKLIFLASMVCGKSRDVDRALSGRLANTELDVACTAAAR